MSFIETYKAYKAQYKSTQKPTDIATYEGIKSYVATYSEYRKALGYKVTSCESSNTYSGTSKVLLQMLNGKSAYDIYTAFRKSETIVIKSGNKTYTRKSNIITMIKPGMRYKGLTPTKTEMLLASMGVNSSVDIYKFFRHMPIELPICRQFNNSFQCYKFYKYDIRCISWNKVHITVPQSAIIIAKSLYNYDIKLYTSAKSIINNTILNDKINTIDIYKYYRDHTSIKAPKVRKPRTLKDTPSNEKRGLVHTDYYNDSLLRDKNNTTKDKTTTNVYKNDKGEIIQEVTTQKGIAPIKGNKCVCDNLAIMFRKDVIYKVVDSVAIKHYNDKCETLAKRLMRTNEHVQDIRIVYGKKTYHKSKSVTYALYMVVFRDDRKPSVLYFDVMGDIAYSMSCHFKGNKATKSDYIRLSKVKDRRVNIYATKVAYEKTHKHVA